MCGKIFRLLDGRCEKCIDECGLAGAGFTCQPACHYRISLLCVTERHSARFLPHTINVKFAPFFATILCRWFGRLAMPVPLDGNGGGVATSMGDIKLLIIMCR